jgi:hypothetical protein
MTERTRPPGWLPKDEYRAIYRRVPRLCVEIVIWTPEQGVLLTRREILPNVGAWHIPDGTPDDATWFTRLPEGLYAEQHEFLSARLGLP